ncbi:molecular chaperone DnaJ [Lujinxingia litoralis]|nr:molecular chaperone DnaJ [Lujinxingia litoralis]
MNVDLYQVLEVRSDADHATIKKAYRRLALRYHPDQNPGDARAEERFKEVAQAYEVLSDPARRAAYDRSGRMGGVNRMGGPSFEGFGDLFEVLNSVFGGATRSATRATRGADIRVRMELSLEEAHLGGRRAVRVPRKQVCVRCEGKGGEPGTRVRTCESCQGSGQVRSQQGFFSLMRDCKRCQGRGRVIEVPCKSCQGTGTTDTLEVVEIAVPRGVDQGQTLRWEGKGEPGSSGGRAGDLLVEVQLKAHPIFERDDLDVHRDLRVSFTEASIGAKIDVATLDGEVVMKLPPGTQEGRVLRLRGQGFMSRDGKTRGDMYVRVRVASPESSSPSSQKKGGLRRGLLGKVRDIFR